MGFLARKGDFLHETFSQFPMNLCKMKKKKSCDVGETSKDSSVLAINCKVCNFLKRHKSETNPKSSQI